MSQTQMAAAERLEANAIIDRLVGDGDTFSAAEARRLISLVPVETTLRRLQYRGKFGRLGSWFKGHAPGVGDVSLGDDRPGKEIKINVPIEHRIGGYVVEHRPGYLEIREMWADTRHDQTGRRCVLRYSAKTQKPMALLLCRQSKIWIVITTITVFNFDDWKTPVEDR